MRDPTKGIVALIPADAIGSEHMTLCYAPRISTNQSLRWMVESLARSTPPVLAHVLDHATFGGQNGDPPVEVARLSAPQLYAMFYAVESWHESEYPFNPHITAVNGRIRPIHSGVVFNRIGMWHDDIGLHDNYRLGTGVPCA